MDEDTEENEKIDEAEEVDDDEVTAVTVKKTRKRKVLTAEMVADKLPQLKEFSKLRFHGKGHERTDLVKLMKAYQNWSTSIFPSLTFPEFISRGFSKPHKIKSES
jgi:hypothetical protein